MSKYQQLKDELEGLLQNRLSSRLADCFWHSILQDHDTIEVNLQEEEDSVSTRIALRLYFIERSKQVHIPNIAVPDSWRGSRLGMNLIRDIFEVCERYKYSLYLTNMVDSFYRYMLSIGAYPTDEDTVEILPSTRLVSSNDEQGTADQPARGEAESQ